MRKKAISLEKKSNGRRVTKKEYAQQYEEGDDNWGQRYKSKINLDFYGLI
jgi:hypothetical protein